MKKTEFILFKNVPDIKLNKQIHFQSDNERDNFFSTNYEKKEFSSLFNFRKDKGVVSLPDSYENYIGFNYGYFIDSFENKKYYFIINNYEYVNDNLTKMYFTIDVIMTFTQGDVLTNLNNLNIERQHLGKTAYDNVLPLLKMNNDILNVHTLKFYKKVSVTFSEFYVLITASVDLEKDFGTEKAPKIPFSKGTKYNNITSPMNLYITKFDKFNDFMKHLQDFSWIAQCIQKCVMIPKQFMDENNLELAYFKKDNKIEFYKFKRGAKTNNIELDFKYNFNDLLTDLKISQYEKHLLKSNYFLIELTDYSGNKISYDISKINSLHFKALVTIGFQNLVKIIQKGYNSYENDYENNEYLDYALTLNDFDELPIFINNAQLTKVNSAYQREFSNSNTNIGKINRITDNSNNIQDRLSAGLSLFSSVSSPTDILNMYSSDYDYYRKQKADFKTYDLQRPTITDNHNPHALQIKEKQYGFFLNIYKISDIELDNIRKYHKLNGYECNFYGEKLSSLTSMSLVNFVKFSGNYNIENIDVIYLNIIKQLFENGVYLYHPISKNPFNEKIEKNEVIEW